MEIVPTGYPMERIAIDILGELPLTENGNKYILVVADYFTKWTESFAMPNMESRTVATILVEEVISRFGVPAVLHSDQGRQFESKLFMEMCSLLGITKTHTTPYHPQSDGMVERFNRTLTTMLSNFVNENHNDWDKHLQYVMMAYRSTIHETTGFSPNALMLGREVCTPLDILYEVPSSIKPTPQDKWVWELQERLENAHKIVRVSTNQEMVRQKHYHDKKLNWGKFNKNDDVYVYFPRRKPGQSPKFTSYWRGPYKVIKKMSDVTYMVDCGPYSSNQVIHVDRMRLKHSQILTGENENIPESLPVDVTHENLSDSDTRADNIDFANENSQLTDESQVLDKEADLPTRQFRCRRPPVWLKDYETEY